MWIGNETRDDKSFPEEAEKGKPCPLAWSSGRLRLALAGLIAANLLWVSAGAEAAKPVLIVSATKNAEHKVSPYVLMSAKHAKELKAAQSPGTGLWPRQPRLAGQVQR
jgi:hypothetical protein